MPQSAETTTIHHPAYSTPMKIKDVADMPRLVFANKTAVEVIVEKASDIMNQARRYLNVSGICL